LNVTVTNAGPIGVTVANSLDVNILNQPIGVEGTLNVTVINASPIGVTIAQLLDVNVTDQSSVKGTTHDGFPVPVRVTPDGSVYTRLREPVSAFGTILTDTLYPIIQASAVYGLNPGLVSTVVFGTGTVTVSQSSFVLSSGTTAGSYAVLQSRKRLFYSPGQGMRAQFSALFPSPASNLTVYIAGLGTPEDGLFFGYYLGTFGILYTNRGLREIRLLTVTTGSSTTQSVNVTLNGVLYSVPVTNSGNIQRTVYELSIFMYNGWKAEPLGNTVRFVSHQAEPAPGSFAFAATTAVAAFSLVRAGVTFTLQFTPQMSWNVDQLDGSPNAGTDIILDPSKYNVYMISLGYLGATAMRFYVQGTQDDSRFILAHKISIGNVITTTSFANPNFPISFAVRTLSPGVAATLSSGSMSGFIEGKLRYTGNRFSFSRSLTGTVDASALYVLYTIRNAYVTNGVTNQGVLVVAGVSGAAKSAGPCTLYLFRSNDATQHILGGNPNFGSYGTFTGILYDEAATTFTISSFSQLLWTGELAEAGSLDRFFLSDLEAITLEPGESISLCAKTNSGSAQYVSASLELREKN
jgi:hypothetical protein